MPTARPSRTAKNSSRRYERQLDRWLKAIAQKVDDSLMDEAASHLGLMIDGEPVISSETDMVGVVDLAMFEIVRDGETAVERYIRTHPQPPQSRDGRILDALSRARLSVFRLMSIEDDGTVKVDDAFGGPSLTIANLGLPQVEASGNLLITRPVVLDDCTLTAGGFLPLDETAMGDILVDLEQRFPGETIEHVPELTGQDRIDFAVILFTAGFDTMEALEAETVDSLLSAFPGLADYPELDDPPPGGKSGAADEFDPVAALAAIESLFPGLGSGAPDPKRTLGSSSRPRPKKRKR